MKTEQGQSHSGCKHWPWFALVLLVFIFPSSSAIASDEVRLIRVGERCLKADLWMGQLLTVYTSPFPLSGFRWAYLPSKSNVVQFLKEKDAEEAKDPLPGGLNIAGFAFQSTAIGCTVLEFVYFAGVSPPGYEQRDRFVVEVCVVK